VEDEIASTTEEGRAKQLRRILAVLRNEPGAEGQSKIVKFSDD
jgi:hypothetical protein